MLRSSSVHERYRRYLEDLSSATRWVTFVTYVTADVRFKDPFNDVRGVDAMRRIFQHMFENVQDVKFRAQDMASEGPMCLMSWHFEGNCAESRGHSTARALSDLLKMAGSPSISIIGTPAAIFTNDYRSSARYSPFAVDWRLNKRELGGFSPSGAIFGRIA